MSPILELVDKLDHIQACFRAIESQAIGGNDLHVVNRDDLALLLDYLSDRQADLLKELAQLTRRRERAAGRPL